MYAMTRSTGVTREPAKTKTELREMLAEAVRNTQPEAKPKPKTRRTSLLVAKS